MHAPAIWRAFPVEQVRPFVRVGNVVALGVAVLAKIVRDFDVERAVRIGESLELDVELLAHDAARSLAAYDIGALDFLRLSCRIGDMRGDAIGVLLEAGERG